jgi:uncharacterized surface protein with fasciclin (FAS1) repeats
MRSTFRTQRTTLAAFSIVAVAALGLAGCSAGSTEEPAADDETTMTEEPMETEESMADPAANLVGPGCAGYAEQVPDGAGSVEGMAQDPVAVAASNNPLLTTLVSAVSGELNPDVNLVDTLNGDEFTVFAPVDDAFAQIDPATIETLKTDSDLLTSILTYHVVPGQLTPDEVVGTQATVQGGSVEVTGSGDELMVNDANVICGGVMTANATVYLVDSVLMPQ